MFLGQGCQGNDLGAGSSGKIKRVEIFVPAKGGRMVNIIAGKEINQTFPQPSDFLQMNSVLFVGQG